MKRLIHFLLCWPLLAVSDSKLDSLRDLLVAMRQKPAATDKLRGATPKFADIKHQLRDWVESKLAKVPADGGEGYAGELNAELRDAGLSCGWDASDATRCPDWYQLGFVSPISLTRSSGLLVLKTGVGIECGYDDSVYLYEWSGGRWRRIWENEQNQYTEKLYHPQHIIEAAVSPNRQMVLLRGAQSWCSSNWRDVYYRVVRLDSQTPLLDESAPAFEPESMLGRITDHEVIVEYWMASLDPAFTRKEIRRYELVQNRLKRVDPVALIPRDFVDSWIGGHERKAGGEFDGPTLRCGLSETRWQVTYTPRDGKPRYFIVEWTQPYHFSIVRVSGHRDPGCSVPDRKADEPGTLFPDRN